jgi:hypothetical protein
MLRSPNVGKRTKIPGMISKRSKLQNCKNIKFTTVENISRSKTQNNCDRVNGERMFSEISIMLSHFKRYTTDVFKMIIVADRPFYDR